MWWIVFSVFLLNIVFGSIIVFVERKSAQTTWAWLMVLFFLPGIGLILYFLLGRELHNNQWNENNLFKTNKLLKHQQRAYEEGHLFSGVFQKGGLERFMAYLHLSHSHAPLTSAQSIDLLTNGDEKFQLLFHDIRHAKSYIHLQYFSISKDEFGDAFIRLLTKKAEQGIDVMLLYDGLGSYKLTKNYLRNLTRAGGLTKAFFPPKSMLTYGSLNHRNHRKVGIIDDEIAYIGGFNIGDKYRTDSYNLGYWRDSHLRLTGSVVHHLHDQFISDWNKGEKKTSKTNFNDHLPVYSPLKKDIPMQIVPSGPGFDHNHIKMGFMQMIQKAGRSIYIQTPYLIPNGELLESLRLAILSGVDVRIMIPNKPDHPLVHWATLFFAGELLKEGATIYVYQKGFLHAKTMVVDDKVSSLGTTNMDTRSVNLNFEVNAFIYNKGFSKRMKETFQSDIDDCSILTVQDYEQRSNWVRFKENVSRLLSPLL